MIFVNDTKGKIGKVLNITNDSTKFGVTLFRSETLNFLLITLNKAMKFQ